MQDLFEAAVVYFGAVGCEFSGGEELFKELVLAVQVLGYRGIGAGGWG